MESNVHHNLVKKTNEFVSNQLNIKKSVIECDIFEISGNVSRMEEGYVPDLYYNYNELIIIGEAKTENDLERTHSLQQFESYIKHLDKYYKMRYKAVLIVAVPWQASISAYRILKRMIFDKNIKLIIINELGVYKEYEKDNFTKRTQL